MILATLIIDLKDPRKTVRRKPWCRCSAEATMRKKVLWTVAIALVVVAIALGVGLGVGLTQDDAGEEYASLVRTQ